MIKSASFPAAHESNETNQTTIHCKGQGSFSWRERRIGGIIDKFANISAAGFKLQSLRSSQNPQDQPKT
jgi:hypothetical protein